MGRNDWAIDRGRRANATQAFGIRRGPLDPHLLTGTEALGLIGEHGRATGVRIARIRGTPSWLPISRYTASPG